MAIESKATEASATTEEYLEAIYNIGMEGDPVIGARLAEKFRVAPPTVTQTLQRLVKNGYVAMDRRRHVTLTPAGVELAEAVLRRHRLTERFLVDMLGMQWHEVHEEACRLEHRISGAVEAHVVAALNHPTTCPHGNPIPGYVPSARTYLADQGALRLREAAIGAPVKILLVSEVVEDEEELIDYLHERGLTPGTALALAAVSDEDGTADLRVGERMVTVPVRVAHALWVVPVVNRSPAGAP
ncbi:MAG TPA: metal-dependent transcriptional regulator [Ktedonobacterales bacterium]|jgi:DtxR family Mn-dependent transcriptional regulator